MSSTKYSVVNTKDEKQQDIELQRKLSEGKTIETTDFETALTAAGFGKFNYIMLLIAIPAACTNSVATATMAYVIPVAGPEWGLTPTWKALLQSAPYMGMIASGFFWGVLSDSYGRKRLISVGLLLDFCMNSLAALIPILPSIFTFKFLSGFMICGPYSIFMAYISEVFLEKKRDIAVLTSGLFGSALQIFQVFVASWVIPSTPPEWLPLKSWQVFILCCGVPSLVTGLSVACNVESPKFLAEKGKTVEALQVCKKIYSINTGMPPETFPVKKIRTPLGYRETPQKIPAMKKFIAATGALRPPYINRLALIFGMQFAIAMTLNVVRLWLPELLTVMSSVGRANQTETLCPLLLAGHKAQAQTHKAISKGSVYNDMIVLNACCFAAQVLFVTTVKYVGKKFIIMGVASLGTVCMVLIPNIRSDYVYIPASLVVAVLAIAFFSQVGLIVEIFPTGVRATSVSMTMLVGRVGILVANFAIANLMFSYCEQMFYTFAVAGAGIVVICLFLNTTPFDASKKKVTRIRHETL